MGISSQAPKGEGSETRCLANTAGPSAPKGENECRRQRPVNRHGFWRWAH